MSEKMAGVGCRLCYMKFADHASPKAESDIANHVKREHPEVLQAEFRSIQLTHMVQGRRDLLAKMNYTSFTEQISRSYMATSPTTQMWSPDTCACAFLEQWDLFSDPASRTFVAVQALPCPIHQALNIADPDALRTIVVEENMRKNAVVKIAVAVNPALAETTGGITYTWDQGQVRTLHVKLVGANAVQRTNIQNGIAANAVIAGKVVLDP